jgi:hypothetical protein
MSRSVPRADVHKCPGCRIFASGHCVSRLGRTWHADCWVKEVEGRARAVVDCFGSIPWRNRSGEALTALKEALPDA